MAGIKGRSGPPNNTNAARYGHRLLWRGAGLRASDAWIRRPLDLYSRALVADKPNITAAERAVLEVAATAKGCTLLILEELKKKGFTFVKDGTVQLTQAAQELPKFLNTELAALRQLGLKRESKQVNDLALAICEDISREEAEEGQP